MAEQIQIIDGPTVPGISGQPLYEVTLASGAIATRPSAFADYRPDADVQHVTVAQNGEVLRLP